MFSPTYVGGAMGTWGAGSMSMGGGADAGIFIGNSKWAGDNAGRYRTGMSVREVVSDHFMMDSM